MRVLLVSGEYPPMKGGVGRYSYNLAQAFRKKGVDVSVAARADSGSTDAYNVIRKGDRGNSGRLLQLVSELEPDVVNVQYERGLYEIDTTIGHTASRILHGSTLDSFYRECPVPVASTLHTVFPYDEYRQYIKERARRKEGRFGALPLPLRAAIRKWVMEQRYDLLLHVVRQSSGIISPARAIRDVVRRGMVIYHGAEPAVQRPSSAAQREEIRREFGLPAGRMLLLAFGYVGSYKGFDILENIDLPPGWSIVVKQTRHERGTEQPVAIINNGKGEQDTISLHLGYLDDATMSKLFFACDAIVFPYKVVSISGVMFDALAHGLPFVASDLQFFREFAELGLGIACKRDSRSFEESIRALAAEYGMYRKNVEQFAPGLRWSQIADDHIKFYSELISRQAKPPSMRMAEA